MFQGYFDDSGTHDGARIAVWGGLIGPQENFERLDQNWRALLRCPIEGKPPLTKFSLSKCMSSEGEFETYIPAERDLVRRRFREAIIDADLAAIAYVVFAEDWEKLLSPLEKQYLGKAQNMAFRGCIESMEKFAIGENTHAALFFDAGQHGVATNSILEAWKVTHPQFGERVSVTFSPVASLTGLQAADMVAGEAYHYGLHEKNPAAAPLGAHFSEFSKRQDTLFALLDGEAIKKYLVDWRQAMRTLFGPLV
jgi:hypothetical protein